MQLADGRTARRFGVGVWPGQPLSPGPSCTWYQRGPQALLGDGVAAVHHQALPGDV